MACPLPLTQELTSFLSNLRDSAWRHGEANTVDQLDGILGGNPAELLRKKQAAINPFRLVIDAYALDEHGDGPGYAVVTVDQAFVDQLERLLDVCKTYHLDSACVLLGPDSWGNEDSLCLENETLAIWLDGKFWFNARPRNSDYLVESRGIDIADLRRIAEAGADAPTKDDHCQWSKGVLYFSGDPGTVTDLIEMMEDEYA